MRTSNSPATDAHPALRPYLEAHGDGDLVVIRDPRMVGRPVGVSPLGLEIVARLDGTRTLEDVQAELLPLTGGALVPLDVLRQLVAALDAALLLDSPRVREVFEAPVRPPACIGTYSADPGELRQQLTALFTAPGGPGMPGEPQGSSPLSADRLRAVLVPHMDYGRGNVTYGHGFKELVENTDARVFVIVATSHHSPHRFTLTRQHFDTPLGVIETDRDYVNRIAEHYGDGLFDDPAAHVPEHSIELEVVLLQFLLGGRRPFKIVPLLTGGIGDCVKQRANPAEADDIARMVVALRAAEAASTGPVCYVISGDLAHIGPKFRDKRKAAGPWLDESRAKDAAILKTLEAADPAAFFATIAAEDNARRICGLPPAWLALEVAKPRTGKVLHYQQYVHPKGSESVSFAAAAFYG
jgi:MEMO1 family protein